MNLKINIKNIKIITIQAKITHLAIYFLICRRKQKKKMIET